MGYPYPHFCLCAFGGGPKILKRVVRVLGFRGLGFWVVEIEEVIALGMYGSVL